MAGKLKTQMLTFDKKKFTEEEVQIWLTKHPSLTITKPIYESEKKYNAILLPMEYFESGEFQAMKLDNGVYAKAGKVKSKYSYL